MFDKKKSRKKPVSTIRAVELYLQVNFLYCMLITQNKHLPHTLLCLNKFSQQPYKKKTVFSEI